MKVIKQNGVIKVFTRAWQGLAGPQGIQGEVGPSGPPYRTTKTITNTDSPYSMQITDHTLYVDASGGAVIVNMRTSLSGMDGSNGVFLVITKIDTSTNAVTVDGDGTEKVAGSLTQVLANEQDSLSIIPDGSNWHLNG